MAFLMRFIEACWCALEFHLRRYALVWGAVLAVALLALGAFEIAAAPPRPFPSGTIIVVTEGETAAAIARGLGDAHIVAHPELLRLLWRVAGVGGAIPAGAYRFAAPQNLFIIAWRLPAGAYGIPSVRVTLIEGATARDMAATIANALPEISAADFISLGQPYEGYLFPDTYSFPPSSTAASVVGQLRATFDEKTAPLSADVSASGRTLAEIVTMASIVEREASREDDRRMVAGILWNRIERKMPLQVDAVFGYIYGRDTYSPSLTDLKIDSPYNTYKYPGLPPGPISNPGLDAIKAALYPAKTNYLYYLTGRDGLMHYAATYAGQKANIAKYLQ